MAKNHHLFLPGLFAISMLLLLSSMSKLQVRAQNLCFSQFALANQACSPVGPPIQRKTELLKPKGELLGSDNDSSDDSGPEEDDENHLHHHHHRRQHHDGFNPEDTPCCRRLMDIDNACVCQIFARLPKFVTKPKHVITVSPVEGCEVTFECDGS